MKEFKNNYHVWRSADMGESIYYPWLIESHAKEMADLLNRIEEQRFERLGIPYSKEIADVYYVQENKDK